MFWSPAVVNEMSADKNALGKNTQQGFNFFLIPEP
jgi:hypothetical protein